MTREEIEREVQRLAPWYYLWDLQGVRTDIVPAFDQHGHREVDVPAQIAHHFSGRSVLDVGCNEGKRGLEALKAGASSLVGFDCREANVAKARFVARVLGIENAEFHRGSVDTWPDERPYDIVLLCGLLYHLPRPWEAIAKYCAMAREAVLMTCVLAGGRKGYTAWMEGETIGACENPAEASQMPNNSATLIEEFARHGFKPVYHVETDFTPGSPAARIAKRVLEPLGLAKRNTGCMILFRRT